MYVFVFYVYICVYHVCIYICMHVRMYSYMYVHYMCVCMYVCICVCINICIYIYIWLFVYYVCISVCVYVCLYVFIYYVCMNVCVFVYIRMCADSIYDTHFQYNVVWCRYACTLIAGVLLIANCLWFRVNSCNWWQTPWNRVLLEKPIVTQMTKKLSRFSRTPGLIITSSTVATCLCLEVNGSSSRPPFLFLRPVKYYTSI